MKYEYFYDPVSHLIIEDFFTEEEYDSLFDLIKKIESYMIPGKSAKGNDKRVNLNQKKNLNFWPYQNREIYESMEKWLTDFMFKTVDLAWSKLEVGGKYGLYIEDKPNYRFMPRLLEYISSKPGAHYLGIIYQLFLRRSKRNEYKLRNVYFFQKNKA